MSTSGHTASSGDGPARGASATVLSQARAARTTSPAPPGLSTEQAALAADDISEQASFVAHRVLGMRLEGWAVTGNRAVVKLEGDTPECPLFLAYDDGMRCALQVGCVSTEGSWLHHRYVFSLAEVADAYETLTRSTDT